jgi:hypothetical protein
VRSIKLSGWANIAEILGAIAVVVSLLFVGFQINDGNRATRAATEQAVLDAEMLFQAEVLRYAETWEKVVTGAPLAEGVEMRRGIVLYNMLHTHNENRFKQMQAGFVEFDPHTLLRPVDFAIYDRWTKSGGYVSRSPEYREFLDAERKRLAAE